MQTLKLYTFKERSPSCIYIFCFLMLLLGLLVTSILPNLSYAADQSKRPRIGLVLGGGGAKGSAHIGVLKVLEELRVPIDYIGGTSMGALVASMYASGMSPDEIERVVTSLNWDDLFTDSPPRAEIDWMRKRDDYTNLSGMELGIKNGAFRTRRAVIAGQKIGLLFETILMPVSNITDFDKLPTPYRAVAVDLETGNAVVLKSGRLADAARASMSVPGVFPPVEVNGRLLADGGIVRNLPVDVVRSMGADIIIAVDVGQNLPSKEQLNSPMSIMNQMVDIMIKENVKAQIDQLEKNDIFIRPELGTISSGDFDRGKEAIERGLQAAWQKEAELRRLSVSEQEYAPYRNKHEHVPPKTVRIGTVTIEGLSHVSPETVQSKLNIKSGQEISVEKLKHDIGIIYGMGDFERVALEAKRRDDVYDMKIQTQEKSWGPNYFRWGLSFSSSTRGDSTYNILADYTMRWLNRFGAEWKNLIQFGSDKQYLSEFYQPLESSRTFFVAPRVAWNQSYVDIYQNNDILAEEQVRKATADADLGFTIGTYGEIRMGYETGKAKQDLYKGTLNIPGQEFNLGAFTGRMIMDQLDNITFPRSGYLGRILYYDSMPGLGADVRYQKIDVRFIKAFTYQEYTLLTSAEYGSYIDNPIPFYDQFTLGGFLRLSGYQQDQLIGQQLGLGRLIAYWRASQSLLGSFYMGASLEAGNVWHLGENASFDDLRMGGSVFIGYDTILGPLYLAVGDASRGAVTVYFYLGKLFFR
jgi:NTE family protein